MGVKIRFVLFISFLFCGLRVCLDTTYFAEIEKLLLKALQKDTKMHFEQKLKARKYKNTFKNI